MQVEGGRHSWIFYFLLPWFSSLYFIFDISEDDDQDRDVCTVRQSGLNCWLEASVSTLSQLVFSVLIQQLHTSPSVYIHWTVS